MQELGDDDDVLAIVNTNRKMLIFKLDELPKMGKGKGVILQKQVSSSVADIKALNFESGLSWKVGSKIREEKDLRNWLSSRATRGFMVPHGFPKNGKF